MSTQLNSHSQTSLSIDSPWPEKIAIWFLWWYLVCSSKQFPLASRTSVICLEAANYNQYCSVDLQCQFKDNNSYCDHDFNVCQCQERYKYNQKKRKCSGKITPTLNELVIFSLNFRLLCQNQIQHRWTPQWGLTSILLWLGWWEGWRSCSL